MAKEVLKGVYAPISLVIMVAKPVKTALLVHKLKGYNLFQKATF
jgi:hypothetical protein